MLTLSRCLNMCTHGLTRDGSPPALIASTGGPPLIENANCLLSLSTMTITEALFALPCRSPCISDWWGEW